MTEIYENQYKCLFLEKNQKTDIETYKTNLRMQINALKSDSTSEIANIYEFLLFLCLKIYKMKTCIYKVDKNCLIETTINLFMNEFIYKILISPSTQVCLNALKFCIQCDKVKLEEFDNVYKFVENISLDSLHIFLKSVCIYGNLSEILKLMDVIKLYESQNEILTFDKKNVVLILVLSERWPIITEIISDMEFKFIEQCIFLIADLIFIHRCCLNVESVNKQIDKMRMFKN